MKKHFLPILFILIFCVWSLRSLFHPGFMYSHDSLWHVQRIQNMFELIPSQFPVRWSPSLDNGYGIPLFNFAYPAPYYLGALLMLLSIGPIKAYYILIFLSYFLGGVGVYLLANRRIWGLIAGLLYLLNPYQFLDIFVRGALGEIVALGLFPWVIIAIQQISKTDKIAWYSPIPFALLLLSHNFYAYLFALLLIILTVTLYTSKIKIIFSLLLSLMLSAFFILPAFFEKSNLLITKTQTQIGDHFVYPRQLFYSSWSYAGSMPGESITEMSYQLGIANIIIMGLGLIYLVSSLYRHKYPKYLLIHLLLLGFAIFMTTPYSMWFWESVPLISSLQFPWRFLGIASILFVLVYLGIAKDLAKQRRTLFLAGSLVLVLVAILNTRNYFRPVKWLNQDEFMALHYEYAGGTTTAHREELVPRWATLSRHNSGPSLVLSSGTKLISTSESGLSLTFRAYAPDAQAFALYHRNYYPAWQGRVDGQQALLSPTDTGEITFPLLPGEHLYTVGIESTSLQIIANTISLLSLLFLLLSAYLQLKSSHPQPSSMPRTSKHEN